MALRFLKNNFFLFRLAENPPNRRDEGNKESNFSGLVPEYRVSLPRTVLVQGLLRGSLLGILALALFLRIYRLPELMVFGGDVARDYLAARDITLKGEIPLVGSPSSVPWLHQGAFFTYLLGVVLWLGRYNPLAGGYFVGIFGVLGVFGIYFLGKKLFSEKVGLISAFFYATSPLIIVFDRYPYHQSLISLFTIVFILTLHETVKKEKIIPLSFFVFGLLLQLELSNLVLLPILLIWIWKYRRNLQFKFLIFSFFLFLTTWIPKIIYDLKNGFTQTLGFIAWIIHKLPVLNTLAGERSINLAFTERIAAIFTYLSRIIFWPSSWLSGILLLGILGGLGVLGKKVKREESRRQLLLLWLFVPMFGFLIQGSPSESYIPVLFGAVALLVGKSVSLPRRRLGRLLAGAGVLAIGIFNSYFLLSKNFFVKTNSLIDSKTSYNLGLSLKLNYDIAGFIVGDAKGKRFNLIPIGDYGYYSSSILNTSYLTWYLGNEPSEDKQPLQYFIYERGDNLCVKKAALVREFPYIIVARKERK